MFNEEALNNGEVTKVTQNPKNMRKEQAAETRQRLLDAAAKLFAENGYARTSVRSINKSIGMADGLMYHYFPGGKEEIIQVIVRERFRNVVLELRALAHGLADLPVEDVMERIYQNWTAVFEKHQDILRILIKENDVMQFVGHGSISLLLQDAGRWFPQYLRGQANLGAIQMFDFDAATDILLAVLTGHFLTKLTGIGAGVLDDELRRKKLIQAQTALWKSPQILP